MQTFNDYMQELADGRKEADIRFRTVEGAVSQIRAHIIGYDAPAGRAMIETDAGIHIGIDQILEVNGRIQEKDC